MWNVDHIGNLELLRVLLYVQSHFELIILYPLNEIRKALMYQCISPTCRSPTLADGSVSNNSWRGLVQNQVCLTSYLFGTWERKTASRFKFKLGSLVPRLRGPRRNLVDVGYGVSQVLPLLTDTHFVQQAPSSVFLLQQPEVHLHPSAQAALGSYFCEIADWKHQLLVETHSDHILDRVRMDVRDRVSRLHPEEVSILYFERRDLDVRIHSLQLDDEGNVLGAPDSYRRFFLSETKRSLGF